MHIGESGTVWHIGGMVVATKNQIADLWLFGNITI